jgi:hypothetical protein
MKKCIKKIVSMFLVFAMVIAVAAPGVVQAKTQTKSLTLYVGEVYNLSATYQIKSVSSSKKSVAPVAKDSSSTYRANITAKKAGKATVTIKTKGGNAKYNVTVKKLDVTGTFTDLGHGNMLLEIKNNTKQTFTAVGLKYTLKDASGEVMEETTTSVLDVVAGKTVYKKIYYNQNSFTPDLSQCTVKAVSDSRSTNAKYTNASSKVNTTVTDERDVSGRSIKFTIKNKNTLKQNVSGNVYILVYDADGNLIDENSRSFYLKSKATDTTSATCSFYTGTDVSTLTYKVSTVAYYYTY